MSETNEPPDASQHGRAEMTASSQALANGDVTFVANGLMTNVHPPSDCAGSACWVHAPSEHHMVAWPVRWREDKRIAERVCRHGTGHPDPDDLDYQRRHGRDVSMHGCDGCCGT